MNISSKTDLTRKLKPLEAPFLPTDDHRFLWLKYRILSYFEDWLKTIEVTKNQRNKKCLYNQKTVKGIKINVYVNVSDVLAERFSQDPLETYFWKQHPGA